MRKVFGAILMIIFSDLAVFWVLKKVGILRMQRQPPDWAKIAFFVPLALACGIGFVRSLYDIWLGWTFSMWGGERVRFSEEPFEYVSNMALKLFASGVLCVVFTMIIFGYGS